MITLARGNTAQSTAQAVRRSLAPTASGVKRVTHCACACAASAPPATAAAFSTLLQRPRSASSTSLCTALAATASPSSAAPSAPTRGLKEWANSKLGSPLRRMRHGLVEIPAFVTADHLAHLLNKTLLQLSKDARRLFPEWWPAQTERAMKKEMYSTAKDIVLSYEESKQIAQFYRRTPALRDLSDREWTEARPFGPPRLQQRPPVIAILGHKDHGKTTLLDRLRGANVAAKEEFGITQETYAFHVDLDPLDIDTGKLVKVPFVPGKHRGQAGSAAAKAGGSNMRVPFSFLDTPGHVSFSEMRQTVGSVCDAILLVVAADEGVLDQTFETLRLARNLARPLIVVINKMDLPGSQEKAARIRRELQELGAKLHPPSDPKVSASGDVVVLETSALTDRTGFRSLKQALLGVANALPLQYDAHYAPAFGTVIESMVLPGRGNLVRVNLQQGTLHRGDYFVAEGVFEGRVKDIRAMRGGGGSAEDESSESGLSMSSVGAGYTVDVMGCISLPNPGASFVVSSCKEQAVLQALVGRNAIKYKDQERVVAMGLPEEEEQGVAKRRPNLEQEGAPGSAAAMAGAGSGPARAAATKQQDAGAQLVEADADEEIDEVEEEEEEYDEVEEEVLDDSDVAAASSRSASSSAAAASAAAVEAEVDDDRTIDADEVPVDLDPRGRVAPPLPAQSLWELSPPPPPSQRAMPLANLRPQFKFYTLLPDASAAEAGSQSRNAASPIALPDADSTDAEKRFGLTVLIKTQNMGALNMLRASIEDMNSVNAARGLPSIHVSYSAAGDLTKRDLVTAESDGCWVYCFRTARPNKLHIQLAKQRHIPLFSFRHHQHLLDHLQHHIEMSPALTATGEAKLEQQLAANTRRSHHTVQ